MVLYSAATQTCPCSSWKSVLRTHASNSRQSVPPACKILALCVDQYKLAGIFVVVQHPPMACARATHYAMADHCASRGGVASVLARQACGPALADVTACADRGRGGPPVKKPIIIPKPINLPSRRAENHGFDPNISLGGWSQSKPTGAPAPSQQQQQQASQPQSQPDARPGWAGGIQAPQAPSLTNNERAFPKLGDPPPGEKPAGKISLVNVKKLSFDLSISFEAKSLEEEVGE